MLTMQGNGGGRDVMDQAAQNMMGRLQSGGQAVPEGAQAPGPSADFATMLAQVVQMVLRGGKAELLQFAQASQFIKRNLGGGQEPEQAMPGAPDPMGMAAQGVPQTGRPPR